MIKLQFNSGDLDRFYHQINLKIEGMQAPLEPMVLTEINNTIFTVSARRFVKAMNLMARQNPKKFHHIYEWERVGDPTKRLYYLRKDLSSGRYLKVGAGFIKSRTPVPIPPELLNPGKTGKSVTSRSIFANKAEVMESGTGVTFQAKKTLAFLQRSGDIGFVGPGTVINILNPGGTQVKGAFEKFFQDWYKINTMIVFQSSGIMETIQSAMSEALNEYNAGKSAAVSKITNRLASMQGGTVE